MRLYCLFYWWEVLNCVHYISHQIEFDICYLTKDSEESEAAKVMDPQVSYRSQGEIQNFGVYILLFC